MKVLLKNIISGSKAALCVHPHFVKSIRILIVTIALGGIVGLMPDIASRAQRPKDGPASVASVSSRTTSNGSVVTIDSDTSLNRVQTWQDSEGYHVTIPYNGQGQVKAARGVKVRQVGRSLEMIVKVKPGANVTVVPQAGRLTLQIDSKLDSQSGEGGENNGDTSSAASGNVTYPGANYPGAVRTPAQASLSKDGNPGGPTQHDGGVAGNGPTDGQTSPQTASNSNLGARSPAGDNALGQKASPNDVGSLENGMGSILFSTSGVLGLVGVGLIGLFVIRRRHVSLASESFEDTKAEFNDTQLNRKQVENKSASTRSAEPSLSLVKPNPVGTGSQGPASYSEAALFGAYRVDQEIGKLVMGEPHRMDVLASRAPDDRRAMEVALIKALTSPNTSEEGRQRARQALEEYGFVARQSATLLAGHDVCERASAARTLGAIGAASSLPFLLEALYDKEPIVRNQCVSSLGTLKLPSAIGALLDVARRHPSIPDSLLSHALSACSVEGFGFIDIQMEAPALLSSQNPDFTGEITSLESTGVVNDLPDFVEDPEFIEALAQLESPEISVRAAAVRQLALFPVQRSVEALASVAIQDPEAAVRGSAVSCLGAINHESVFAPVLIALADESREVRAAAARSLTGLSFDRADAYVRVIETANQDMLRHVAHACIKAGIVSQAIDRLASNDRRQAYEAFSLLSLLAKANETQPILDAIEQHQSTDVRLCAVRVLGLSGQLHIAEAFRQLAGHDDIPEAVRTSILDVIYKIDQAQPGENLAE